MRVDAHPTRTGIFIYRNPDGTDRRELRPAEEVFKQDSLDTLAGAPVTIDHPSFAVNATNWKSVSVGHVGDKVVPEGKFVDAQVVVTDEAAVKRVESKGKDRLVELSCGYSCDLDPTPGVFEGERYDGIQRNISYNHLALLPEGRARGGSEVRLRLDGIPLEEGEYLECTNLSSMELAEALAALKKAEAERDAALASNTNLKARCDAFEASVSSADARLDEAVNSRVKLREDARQVLGATAALPASDREIMVAVIQKADPGFKADAVEESYLRPRFDAEIALLNRHNAGKVNAAVGTGDARQDGLKAAQAAMIEKGRNAWKAKA